MTTPPVYYIGKTKSKSPLKYHTSAQCPMVRSYSKNYKAVTTPPPGYTHCERYGPCREGS